MSGELTATGCNVFTVVGPWLQVDKSFLHTQLIDAGFRTEPVCTLFNTIVAISEFLWSKLYACNIISFKIIVLADFQVPCQL